MPFSFFRRLVGVSNSRTFPRSKTSTFSQYPITFSRLCVIISRVELLNLFQNAERTNSSIFVLNAEVGSSSIIHRDSSIFGIRPFKWLFSAIVQTSLYKIIWEKICIATKKLTYQSPNTTYYFLLPVTQSISTWLN